MDAVWKKNDSMNISNPCNTVSKYNLEQRCLTNCRFAFFFYFLEYLCEYEERIKIVSFLSKLGSQVELT